MAQQLPPGTQHSHAAAHGAGHGADHHHHHDAHAHHHDVSVDRGSAFVGLIAGSLILGAIVFGMVKWTNSRFEGHARPGAPAAAGQHK